MKRKHIELKHGNQVRFTRVGAYGADITHTIVYTVATCGIAKTNGRHRRIFKLRSSDGKNRFAAEHELRLASKKERY